MGPMTGGGIGYCYSGVARTRWFPYRTRRGASYSYSAPQPVMGFTSQEQEIDVLNNEIQELKKSLEEINARIKELTDKGK